MEDKKYCAVFYQTHYEDGLTPKQITSLASFFEDEQEIEFCMVDGTHSVARGFIDLEWLNETLDFNDQKVKTLVSEIIDDLNLETESKEYKIGDAFIYIGYPKS